MRPPFGIAVYPGARRLKVDPLPPTSRLLTYHESAAGRMETRDGRLVTVHFRRDDYDDHRTAHGLPGRETATVRRRPTIVPRAVADLVAERVLRSRRLIPRSRLAREIGITPYQLHLAELGSVQPRALRAIADHFGLSDVVTYDRRSSS